MAVVPIILLLVAGAVIAAAQLTIQTDQLALSLLMLAPLVPAILLTRLRSAPRRLTAVKAGPDVPRRLPRGV
jgi:predicted permease